MAFTVTSSPIKRGGLAKLSGCNIETIRYYEKIGLLPVPDRTDGGHRLYAPADQARLGFILRGRELGFSIDELRSLLCLVDSGSYTCGEVLDLTKRHLMTVREKINDLRKLEAALSTIAKDCDGSQSPDCPVIEALQHVITTN